MTVEMVIILKSTWAASHGKRSALAVRDARAHTLISKETFLFSEPLRSPLPLFAHTVFSCVWVCDKEMHKSTENVQLLVKFKWRDYTAAQTPRLCRLIRFVLHSHHLFCLCPIPLSFILPFVSSPYSWWSVGRVVHRCTVKRSRRPAPTRLWSCSGWRVYRKQD